MLRSGRLGRVLRVASAVNVLSGRGLGRLSLVGGLVVGAWLFGSAAASADEIGDLGPSSVTQSVGEAADTVDEVTKDVSQGSPLAGSCGDGQAAERSERPVSEKSETVGEKDQAEPAVDISESNVTEAVTDSAHSAGGGIADDVTDTVARAIEDATEENAQEAGASDHAAPDDDHTPERVDAVDDLVPAAGDHVRAAQRSEEPVLARTPTVEAATITAYDTGGSGLAGHSEEKPVRDGIPGSAPPSSSPQVQNSGAAPVCAGFLPAASLVPPAAGLHGPAPHSRHIVPENPVDIPTVSPD